MNNRYAVFSFLLLVLLAVSCQAQEYSWGGCPNYNVKQSFDVDSFAGKWYEVYKYYNRFEEGGKCNTATYSKNSDGTVKVYNEMSKNGGTISSTGKAWFSGYNNEAKLSVNMGIPLFNAPYWILDTDYTNYAVVYSCSNLFFGKAESLWVMTRTRTPSQIVLERAWAVMNERSIATSKLQASDQTLCL